MSASGDLHGACILVMRPALQGIALCQQIRACGGVAIHFPTIAFEPPEDILAFHGALAKLGKQEWLIFNSPQAVLATMKGLRAHWPHLPPRVKIAAIGQGTASKLKEAGLTVQVCPEEPASSESLLALEAFQNVVNKPIAIIRGAGGRELIDRVMTERGARVLPVIAYQRVLPQGAKIEETVDLFRQNSIDAMIGTSFEAIRNLKIMLTQAAWPYLQTVPLLVMSERIRFLAQELGFTTLWVTPSTHPDAMLQKLSVELSKRREENPHHNAS